MHLKQRDTKGLWFVVRGSWFEDPKCPVLPAAIMSGGSEKRIQFQFRNCIFLVIGIFFSYKKIQKFLSYFWGKTGIRIRIREPRGMASGETKNKKK